MNYLAIRALIRNDLRIYMTDRRAMMIGVLVPILIAAFFGYVFGGNGSAEAGKIPIAVVDEDDSDVSRAIAADLAAEPLLAMQALDRTEAERRVRGGKVQVAAIIPKNFGGDATRALFSGQTKPQVELLIDPSQAMSSRVVEGLLAQHGMQEITKEAFSGASDGSGPAAGLQRGLSMPYVVATTKMTSAQKVPYSSYAHSFAGMTTQFILLAGIDAAIVLLLTRERGLWQRLRSAPLSKTQFLLARTLATTLVGLFQFVLIYAAAIGVFGVRIGGSVIGFAAIAVALCLLNATFGLMLASIGRSAAATRGIAVIATLLLVMVGGAWVPSFIFPKWLQQVSLATPTRWAVDGLDAMTWRSLGLDAALPPILVLSGSALLCLAIAIWQFRWEE
ncbi:MAG TPA: ABC transporter permease [Steroidobacteraceae bacterium]|jgi:ABC-2 type transport system permease protein|nr:ABC transporter permease [Steroidobacteraceae bacterium]